MCASKRIRISEISLNWHYMYILYNIYLFLEQKQIIRSFRALFEAHIVVDKGLFYLMLNPDYR